MPRRASTEVGVHLVTESEAPVGQSSGAVGACEETGGTVSSGAVMSQAVVGTPRGCVQTEPLGEGRAQGEAVEKGRGRAGERCVGGIEPGSFAPKAGSTIVAL